MFVRNLARCRPGLVSACCSLPSRYSIHPGLYPTSTCSVSNEKYYSSHYRLFTTTTLFRSSDAAAIDSSLSSYDQEISRDGGRINLYKPLPSVLNRSLEEIEAYRAKHQITFSNNSDISSIPAPVLTFEEVGFPQRIVQHLSESFDAPMPIQAQGWPIALSGLDMIGVGQTGSGKTYGYILPAIMHIRHWLEVEGRQTNGPIALVLAPTRELAQQIESVVKGGLIRSVCLYGGASKGPQIRNISRGVDLVIATPGRLLDLMECGEIDLSQRCSYVVLDEADRMLDMGFEPQIRKVLEQVTRPGRQMLMWSATWPEDVRELAADFFTSGNAVRLNIGSTSLAANKNITQVVKVLRGDHEKMEELINLLEKDNLGNGERILIFAETKRSVDSIERALYRRGMRQVAAIHGNKSQSERDRVLTAFRNGRCSILVATNVASRGIDVSDIRMVVNFDHPSFAEDYVHRIGRTGRQNKLGKSVTFFTENDSAYAKDLIQILRESDQEVNPRLEEMADDFSASKSFNRKQKRFGSGGGFRRQSSFYGGRDDGSNSGYGSNGRRYETTADSRRGDNFGISRRRDGGRGRSGGNDYGRRDDADGGGGFDSDFPQFRNL